MFSVKCVLNLFIFISPSSSLKIGKIVFFVSFFLLNKLSEAEAISTSSIYFFEIVSPESLRYSFEVWSARDFGAKFTNHYKKIQLVLSDPQNACTPLTNEYDVKWSVVLIERGDCSFMSKSFIAENAGAVAVIVTDTKIVDDVMIEMVKDDSNKIVNIPVVYLPGSDGRRLRQHLLYNVSPIYINIPLNLTLEPVHKVKKPPWNLW